jgi:hypothetical protein
MTAFSEYIDNNKEKVYSVATANTKYNEEGRPIVLKDDEWVSG